MADREYRGSQFKQLIPLIGEPEQQYKLKIIGNGESTHWLNISEEEFSKIVKILMEVKDGIR